MTWQRIDNWHATEWDDRLAALAGATFYQAHAWGEIKRRLGWDVVRLAKGASDSPFAMAQVLVRRYPLGGAICWVPGGPAGDADRWADDLGTSLKRLLRRSWLYLRVNALRPHVGEDDRVLRRATWMRPFTKLSSGLSLAYDPSVAESDRLALSSGNWRHNLRRSEKYPQVARRWITPTAADLRAIYVAMEGFKNLPSQVGDAELDAMIECLGDSMILYRCDDVDGQAIALRACAVFAGTAWDLLAAATPRARKQYASHATLWALLRECGERGIRHYDMGGADPEQNKGVFDFKKGVGAKPFHYLGEWEWASPTWLRRVANFALQRRGG